MERTLARADSLTSQITKAAAALAKASTSAEILDAKILANVAYTAAKMAARFAKAKDAHDDIVAACRKAMADALVIEAGAQCRLADEYDAAQERGEVQKHGGQGKRDIPNGNIPSAVADIGLTSKQVHEARSIRDTLKKKPDAIEKALAAKLEAGQEPTHADVKRVVNGAKTKSSGTRDRVPKEHSKADVIAALMDRGMTMSEISAETGVGQRQVRHIIDRERIKREAQAAPRIERSDLSLTMQQKYDAAVRRKERELDLKWQADFAKAVSAQVDKALELEIVKWNARMDEAERVLKSRRSGLMTKATYNKIIKCLHADKIHALNDDVLNKQFNDAFMEFSKLKKCLLSEADDPTDSFRRIRSSDLPELKRKAREERSAKRKAAHTKNELKT